MFDSIENEILMDASDIIVPGGWAVLSHGTSFDKWVTPMLGRPSQNLKSNNRITVHDTVDGGLACVLSDNSHLPFVYAGQENPVIFRVLVPQFGPAFDANTIDAGLRFLKPQHMKPEYALVPADTTLLKVAEIEASGSEVPVIWYVPEQFASLLGAHIKSLNTIKATRAASKDVDVSEPMFNIDDSFAAADDDLQEEHLLEQPEKADEYYENLEEHQQAIIDEELAAEEKLAKKRAADKAKARAQDKKNIAHAEAEHERYMAEANELRNRAEQPPEARYSETAYSEEKLNGAEQYVPFIDTPSSEPYSFAQNEASEDLAGSEGAVYHSEPDQTLASDDVSNSSSVCFYYYDDQAPSFEGNPDYQGIFGANSRGKYQHDERFEAEQNYRREQAHQFQDNLQAEALRRQQQSENYKSFGSSGIDFSGHEDHTAYLNSNSKTGGATRQFNTEQPRTISSDELERITHEHQTARQNFRNFGEAIPESVAMKYKEASERYYTLQRQIEEGLITVKQNPSDSGAPKTHSPSYPKNNNSFSPSVGASTSDPIRGPGAGNNATYTTVQNAQTGDAPTPRSASSLKNPPKSPEDLTPLYFQEERFRAIKRWGNNVGNSAVSMGGAIKNEMVHITYSEDSGTAHRMVATSRVMSGAITAMDALAKGSGKSDAAKVWSKHVANETGQKYSGVNKQAVAEFGKMDAKHISKKLQESLTEKDLAKLHKKFGKDADVGVATAVGTKNGRIGKQNVFVNGKVDVRLAEGQIGSLREKATNLKQEIKKLQTKNGPLTTAERQKYADLVQKKKIVDDKLKRTVGATNSRHQTERLYRQINAMSPKKLNLEIKRLEERIKNGFKLNKVQLRQFKAMKERQALLKMHKHVAGRGLGTRGKRVAGVFGRQVGKMLRESGDDTFATMMSLSGKSRFATRFVSNRYSRKVLKWSIKATLYPLKLSAVLAKKADRKFGISKGVKKRIDSSIHSVSSKIIHTKPGAKIHSVYEKTSRFHKTIQANGGLKKSVKKGIRTGISKITPNKAKLAAKRILESFKKFNNNKFVKGVKAVFKAPFKGFKWLNTAIGAVKKVLLKYVLLPIAVFLLGAFVVSVICSLITAVPSAVFCGDEETDGKIDLTSYISTLNDEQSNINQLVANHKNNTEANGGKYKRVYVNYLGGANSNNYKEILSMTAVYFQQDFSNKDAVDDYLVQLFNASNYVTTSESSVYYCTGCEERSYHCYDATDEYATDERINLHKDSDHSDETYVGQSANAQKGCKKSALYSCMERGHGTYNAKGCQRHNSGKAMSSPGDCTNYTKVILNTTRQPEEPIEYAYKCQGHCSGKHYDYSCPGHTEKICKGHVDLYVNVVCMGFDQIFSADPGVTVGLDLGDYKQGNLMGTFDITYYCTEKHAHVCNDAAPGTNDDGKTASGTKVTPGRTIAVDSSVIPLGTPLIINGHLYIAEDTGGAIKGNRIDIAVATHQEALNLGTDVFKVYKAVEKDESDSSDVQRDVVQYLQKAKEAASEDISSDYILRIFGQAKDPIISWKTDRVNADDEESFAHKLQNFDENHKNEEFSNAELNAFEYVKMSLSELRKLAKERDSNSDEQSAYVIITEVLLPYDKEHPDVFVQSSEDDAEEYYFQGWNKDNKEWAKNIFTNMNSDIYVGLDKMSSGSANPGAISLEGVEIQGSKIKVKYYCQKDYPTVPMIPEYPQYTIKSSGCGFTSMSIVVSSLTSTTIDPPAMVNKYGRAYYSPGQGAYWSIVSGVSADYGLSCQELGTTNVQGIINSLKNGKLVVVLVGKGGVGYTGTGYYKGGGHFLVICGVTDDGKFLLADPNQKAVSVSGTGIEMQHFLNSGIKSVWAVGK